MKIAICPLVSRDIPKAIRAVNSIRNMLPTSQIKFDVVAIINSLNQQFVDDFSKWCQQESVEYRVTVSKGTPAAGKNQCLKFLRESNEYDGIGMLDGDDMYYPTAGLQIERHLLHHPGTDCLIVKPSDQITNNANNGREIVDNVYACCWSNNLVSMGYHYGPGKNALINDRFAATNLGGHVFYSKKLANFVEYDEKQLLGEDLLLELFMLKLHQQAKISFWLSFASDVQFLDRTGNENVQSVEMQKSEICYNRIADLLPTILNPERSSFNELPVEFPEILFSYDQKIEWIKTQIEKINSLSTN